VFPEASNSEELWKIQLPTSTCSSLKMKLQENLNDGSVCSAESSPKINLASVRDDALSTEESTPELRTASLSSLPMQDPAVS